MAASEGDAPRPSARASYWTRLRAARVIARRQPRDVLAGLSLGALATFVFTQFGITDIAGAGDGPGVVIAGAACGALVSLAVHWLWLAVLDAALLAAYALVALTPIAATMAAGWVRDDSRHLTPADAIVVLSGGLQSDSTLGGGGADRLLAGLELVRQGVASSIVTTRMVVYVGGRRVTSDADQRRLIRLAALEGRWTVIDSVGNTHDEARLAAAALFPQGSRRIVLVTSALHTRRACATFEAVGFVVQCVAALERARVMWRPETPADRLASFRASLYERIGMRVYRSRRWIAVGTAE